jgi:hypothetical protein
VWLDEVPLKVSYHGMFQICSDPNVLVGKAYEEGDWMIHFRRELTEYLSIQWEELYEGL